MPDTKRERKVVHAGAGGIQERPDVLQDPLADPVLDAPRLGGEQVDHVLDPACATGSASVITPVYGDTDVSDSFSYANRLSFLATHTGLTGQALHDEALRTDFNPGGVITRLGPQATQAPVEPPNPYAQPAFSTGVRPPVLAQRHKALVIANRAYLHTTPLRGAERDGQDMAAALTAQGADVEHLQDVDGATLSSRVRTAGAGVQPGQELTVYFAGHGTVPGAHGVDARAGQGVAPWSDFLAPVQAALSGGFRATVITDACRSGVLQSLVDVEAQERGIVETTQDCQPVTFREIARDGAQVRDPDTDQVRTYTDTQMQSKLTHTQASWDARSDD